MTTLFSTTITANQTPAIARGPVAHGRVALVALWLTQIGLAAMFMFVGGLKLAGAPNWSRCSTRSASDSGSDT